MRNSRISYVIDATTHVRQCFFTLTACTSNISTVKSYDVNFIDSKTCLRVMPSPLTTSLAWFFNVFLMNLNKCFWFMHEAACIWVSTFLTKQHERILYFRETTHAIRQYLCTLRRFIKHGPHRGTAREYLSYVVEISMRNSFLRGQFPQLVQQYVQLKFRWQIGQSTVAKRFSAVNTQNINNI